MPPPSPEASDWWLRPSRNASKSSTANGLATTKPTSASTPGQQQAAEPRTRHRRGERRGDDRQHEDPRRVLGRARHAEREAGDRVAAVAVVAVDRRDAQQRQADRRQRRHVVERQVGVVHGQERDRQQRARDQARRPAQQAAPGPRQQRDRARPEDRGDDPRGLEHARAVGRHRLPHPGPAAEAQVEDDVQQVRVGGRVDEVARVVGVPEHPDRARHEVGVLVGVVDVGQAVGDPPQAQHERPGDDPGGRQQPAALPPPAAARTAPDGRRRPQHETYAE